MKEIHIRMNDYTYQKLLIMKKQYGYKTINELLNELIQIGYIEMEKMPYEKKEQFMYIDS